MEYYVVFSDKKEIPERRDGICNLFLDMPSEGTDTGDPCA
jgi:hypothetical protein